MCIYSIHYVVSLSVRYTMGEMCFLAAVEDRQLIFIVMIPIIYEYLLFTVFCPSVCRSCLKIQIKTLSFQFKKASVFMITILLCFYRPAFPVLTLPTQDSMMISHPLTGIKIIGWKVRILLDCNKSIKVPQSFWANK